MDEPAGDATEPALHYVIKKAVIGRVPELPTNAERFEKIVRAREGVSETLEMEEKYNHVLENYVAFETYLLTTTVEMVMFRTKDWSDFMVVSKAPIEPC